MKLILKLKLKLLLLTLFVSLLAFPATAQKTIADISDAEFEEIEMVISGTFAERKVTGKVVGVHDGDTATVLDANKTQYKFRFNGIDAPELKMEFGQKSKQNLSDLIFGKEVMVVYNKVDKYGRYVGTVFVGGVNANLEQIKAGLAWHYKKYADEQSEADRKTYSEAEEKARAAKLGFWSLPNPTAPWDYRTALKAKQQENRETRKYLVGTEGGCYYINSSGKKSYVDKKFCENTAPSVTELNVTLSPKTQTKPAETKPDGKKESEKSDGRVYIKGSRGGCYYMNGDKKVYVKDKSLCGN